MKINQLDDEKVWEEITITTLESKRKELILKVLGQLYKGKVGTLQFKKGFVYKISEDKIKNIKNFNHYDLDFEILKKELLKNIHDIYKKFNEENLSVLEFLMNKMDMDWNSAKGNEKIQEIKEDIKRDTQEIKDRCANYLLIMAIEEEER